MKYAGFVFCCLLVSQYVSAQVHTGQIPSSKIPAPAYHYLDEYRFDTVVDKDAWDKEKRGLHVSFASNDHSYFRSEVPKILPSTIFRTTAWKGERVNILLLVWSPDSLEQVRIEIPDLKNRYREQIDKEAADIKLVKYVVSNYPYGAKDATCGESHYKDVYLMPDRLEPFERFDLPGRTVRPIWISIDVPENTIPGLYKGSAVVRSETESITLPIEIQVQNQVLPKPADWKHRLDLWQNPWVLARYNHIQPWSEQHISLLKEHLKLYADAGGKYITTYAVHSPWSDNSYMVEETMIEWIKTKDGKWVFDYSIFDKYVQLAMDAGIDKAITIYTPIPWGNRFRYVDAATGNYIYPAWQPGTDSFRMVWNSFLTDLKAHLEKKGWLQKTYLGINENPMEQTLAAIKVIKEHSKEWKITYAGDWHKELDGLLDDYSFLYGKESTAAEVHARTERGFTTSYYVCCNPPIPNNFVFSPPAESRWISWYTMAHGYSGFLRWAYDAWPSDVVRDARHPFWPAGDCFLVYPGGQSSVRLEKLREGIVDFEKLQILKEKAAQSKEKKVGVLWSELEQHLESLLQEKDVKTDKVVSDLEKGKAMIIMLSEMLSEKKKL